MDNDTLNRLIAIENLLTYPAQFDHYCDEDGCTLDNPKCSERHTQAALVKLQQMLEPKHESLQPRRLANDAERIFADQWQKENDRRPGTNHGYTLLEWIVTPSGDEFPERVSQRDAHVAASVIQWLGTGCGYGFLLGCEQLIKKAKAERSSWGDYVNRNAEPPDADLATAELLAGPVKPHAAHHDLVRGICAALRKARLEAIGEALNAA